MAQVFTIITESEDYRPYRLTFVRANYGSFPKLTKVERQQGNGRTVSWLRHDNACHGELPGMVVQAIALHKDSVRTAR
ncbi:hypothetical protein [Mesorhizobium sp. M8A.F.Ca.ET.021.01.1.1]|uniref:hypothetical protein n=1 Tax=Mesorhizobium sp. M8A.F.Ca.ET.021.01.1.1 TaxID=2496757 RepID=UPI000FC9DEEB|nr:hypothetical protein [Mesorhizobium sp. M8A.F.Ca.ET.021.01.1.1]RUW56711.1 hypothetical protein EOA36_02685 [Mesorhizobium sp. M8A.F.Ca.ET.021.01.1.1]